MLDRSPLGPPSIKKTRESGSRYLLPRTRAVLLKFRPFGEIHAERDRKTGARPSSRKRRRSRGARTETAFNESPGNRRQQEVELFFVEECGAAAGRAF